MIKKPKILVIPSWYPNIEQTSGGTQFQEQAELLLERYDVRVLFGAKSALPLSKWILQNGFKHASPMEEVTTPAGLNEFRFDFKSWLKDEKHQIGSMIEAYKQSLVTMIQSGWKPDLIHARCTDPAGVVANYLSKMIRVPYVLSEHQKLSLGNFSEYYARLMRRAIKSADVVTVVSQHQLRSIATHYLFPKMVVTGNLIDEIAFPLMGKEPVVSHFTILTVMYPHPIKGTETFFETLNYLNQNGHSDIRAFVIGKKVGTKDDISEFHMLVEKFNLGEIVQLIPNVPREEMPAYFGRCDVFVSTAVVETFGIAVREAMMVGKPVVCTASGGVDDDIFDFNGFKVDIYDYKSIANALIAIKTGAVKFDRNKIRDYVVSKYGRQVYLDRFSSIYENVLNTKIN